MNALLIIKDINTSINLINKINSINTNISIYKILTNLPDNFEIITNHSIDIIIIDYENLKNIQKIDLSLLENLVKYLIIISNSSDILLFKICKFSKENSFFDTLKKLNSTISDEIYTKNFISNELKYIGYNPSYNGTKYLIECIYYIYQNYSTYSDNSFANVYSIISKKYKTSINTLKCNISRATSIMFSENDEEKLKSYLGIYTLPKTGYRIIIQTILNKLNSLF